MSKAICLLARSLRTTSALELVVRSCAYKRARIPFVPVIARSYTTQKSLKGTGASQREKITIASDDGHVEWGELSIKEKAARTTQQSFNFMIIVAGIVMTGTRWGDVQQVVTQYHTSVSVRSPAIEGLLVQLSNKIDTCYNQVNHNHGSLWN
ncbi:MAG: hypothetical protein M1836_006618 [Candelina mexicana]|nr:MAG: hypothetical protein M1836_006618 [Candelina mexicana]